ncbi:MAG: DUF2007 domain-containing protein [Pseudomonadota bacterium]
MRSTDLVLIDVVKSLLRAENIGVAEFDSHMSVLEGSIAVLVPRRLMVADDYFSRARLLLTEAGLAHHLTPQSAAEY